MGLAQGGKMNTSEQIMYQAMMTNDHLSAIKVFCEETALNDPQLAEGLKSPDKSFEKCWSYIEKKAKKHLEGNSGYIMPPIIFGWVLHYFIEANETLEAEVGKIYKAQPIPKEDSVDSKPTKKRQNKAGVSTTVKASERGFELISMFDLFEQSNADVQESEESDIDGEEDDE